MPREIGFDEDFEDYEADRRRTLKNIRQLTCYFKQLEIAVKAFPERAQHADYMDLDNIQQLNGDLEQAVEDLCDWDGLGLEWSRLGVKAHSTTSAMNAAQCCPASSPKPFGA